MEELESADLRAKLSTLLENSFPSRGAGTTTTSDSNIIISPASEIPPPLLYSSPILSSNLNTSNNTAEYVLNQYQYQQQQQNNSYSSFINEEALQVQNPFVDNLSPVFTSPLSSHSSISFEVDPFAFLL